jgi:hypothetical protein
MPRNQLETWQDFAKAASQEQDPRKLSYLIKKLHDALDDNEKAHPKESNPGRAA